MSVEETILPIATVKAKSCAVNFAKERKPVILVNATTTTKIIIVPIKVCKMAVPDENIQSIIFGLKFVEKLIINANLIIGFNQ